MDAIGRIWDDRLMFGIKDYLSQWTLELTSNCQLKCQDCALWERPGEDMAGLLTLLCEGAFFSKFPKKRLFNLVGGEPCEYPLLEAVISKMKEQGLGIRLWSNGNVMPEFWEKILPFVDEVMLYFPTLDSESYQLTTGFGVWEDFEATINSLVSWKGVWGLHTPVIASTVSELPDMYDFARSKGALFYLHYFKGETFYANQEAYVKRFYRVKGAHVYVKKQKPPSGVCPVFPYGAIQEPMQVLKNAFFDQFK